jgi:hypothetical protein
LGTCGPDISHEAFPAVTVHREHHLQQQMTGHSSADGPAVKKVACRQAVRPVLPITRRGAERQEELTSPDLAVLAREWLRDYHSDSEWEITPDDERPVDAMQLPKRNN